MPGPLDDLKSASAPFFDGKLDWRDVRALASCLMIAATLLLTLLQVMGAPSDNEMTSGQSGVDSDSDTDGDSDSE
jgi:hypothetical protein